MNRHHPYGGYDQGAPDHGNRPTNEGTAGGYYPPQHHMQQPPPQHYQQPPPPMNNQNDYQGGPARDYRESNGAYPPGPHDYRSSVQPGMPPSANHDGRMGSASGITLGSGPLNSQSQYGGPIRYDGGANGGQSPAAPHHSQIPYGAPPPPDAHRYAGENVGRGPPSQMRAQSHYDSHLPPKPDAGHSTGYSSVPPRPSLGSPPSHLPRPPGREWNDDQPKKRARRDGSNVDDEKASDEVIKERLKRERPCRTLFVRNVEFNADIDELRRRFEEFGEIKSWFDLTSKRGLLFISYFDLRCAEYAKGAMQEFEVNGRRLDVHYSLPREVDMTKRCDRDKDQGTLFILLKRAQGELNDDEVKAAFAQYGEIKSLRRYKDQGNCRFLEYFDCRACKAAHDAFFGATWNGGTWDIKFAWDAAAPDRISEKPRREREAARPNQRESDYGSGYGGGGDGRPAQSMAPSVGGPPHWAGSEQSYGAPPATSAYPPYGAPPAGSDYRAPPPPGPSPGSGGPPPGASYGTKRPHDYDDRPGPEPPMRRWGQAQGSTNPPPGQYGPPRPEPHNGGGGYGQGVDRPPYGGQSSDYGRYEEHSYGAAPHPVTAGPPPPNRWGAAPPTASSGYGPPPHLQQGGPSARPPPPTAPQRPPPPQQPQQQAPATDDRLEQAQKVQQLLASLKPGNAGGATKAPTISSPVPSAAPAATSTPSLPSNIAALLQMAQNNANKR